MSSPGPTLVGPNLVDKLATYIATAELGRNLAERITEQALAFLAAAKPIGHMAVVGIGWHSFPIHRDTRAEGFLLVRLGDRAGQEAFPGVAGGRG